jgi:hypothetical protein
MRGQHRHAIPVPERRISVWGTAEGIRWTMPSEHVQSPRLVPPSQFVGGAQADSGAQRGCTDVVVHRVRELSVAWSTARNRVG